MKCHSNSKAPLLLRLPCSSSVIVPTRFGNNDFYYYLVSVLVVSALIIMVIKKSMIIMNYWTHEVLVGSSLWPNCQNEIDICIPLYP